MVAIKIVLAVVKRIFKYQLLREADKNHFADFFLAKEGSSGGAGLLQMMIRRDQPLANDHPSRLSIVVRFEHLTMFFVLFLHLS